MIIRGTVHSIAGGLIYARLPRIRIGEGVRIGNMCGRVEAFRDKFATIAGFGAMQGIAAGATIATDASANDLRLGIGALGRAIDASGAPLDGEDAIEGSRVNIEGLGILPEERRAVASVAWTGVRAIDGLLPFARGARIGIFGAPGSGKSVLLGAIVRGIYMDSVVVGLIGERGREAEEWIRNRTPRTTIVCATSDRSASERVRAVEVAFAQAHTLRARGLHVVLVLDSLARYANALREIAIATGESAGRGGYPPSVFARMARTLEIAGATHTGTITLIATILDDGDDRDPVSDAARSLLDGHIALSWALAHAGHFPAIDITASASRTMPLVAEPEHVRHAQRIRGAIAYLERTEETRSLGIVSNDPKIERILAAEMDIRNFLRQDTDRSDPVTTLRHLDTLARLLDSTGEESLCN